MNGYDDERTDSDRLQGALQHAAETLREVVGLPQRDGQHGPRVRVDAAPLIDRERVSFSAHVAACNALECIGLGLGVLDLDAPSLISVEDGLAAMTAAASRAAPTAGWQA